MDEIEKCKKSLQSIFRVLDNLEYECNSSIYTLDDDEMSWVFYCRDLAEKTLNKLGSGHNS